MGQITALFARKVIAAAGPDIAPDDLLRMVRLPREETDVKTMVADVDYYALLEKIAATLADATDFPLRVGASMQCDDYGAFGLAWKTAPTLRGSIERAERYARLLTSVAQYEIQDRPTASLFLLHRAGPRTLGMRLSNEATLASSVAIMREVAPAPVVPQEVHFQHRAPKSVEAHLAYFGCPVVFDAPNDGILLSADTLAQPNRLGDPAIAKFLRPHLDSELEAGERHTSFEQTLLRRISDRLSEGPPRTADLAREMGMSERTLHRRLSDGGTSFQILLEQARRQLAEGLLLQSDHPIAEIAFLTGFSEQSAFTRAFKRWVAQTPAAWREQHKAV